MTSVRIHSIGRCYMINICVAEDRLFGFRRNRSRGLENVGKIKSKTKTKGNILSV